MTEAFLRYTFEHWFCWLILQPRSEKEREVLRQAKEAIYESWLKVYTK